MCTRYIRQAKNLQVIPFEIDCAICYTNLHELFFQFTSWGPFLGPHIFKIPQPNWYYWIANWVLMAFLWSSLLRDHPFKQIFAIFDPYLSATIDIPAKFPLPPPKKTSAFHQFWHILLSLEIVDFIQYKKPMVLWSTFFKMPKTKYVHSIQCNDLQKKISIQCRAMIKKKNRNCRLQIAYGAHIF